MIKTAIFKLLVLTFNIKADAIVDTEHSHAQSIEAFNKSPCTQSSAGERHSDDCAASEGRPSADALLFYLLGDKEFVESLRDLVEFLAFNSKGIAGALTDIFTATEYGRPPSETAEASSAKERLEGFFLRYHEYCDRNEVAGTFREKQTRLFRATWMFSEQNAPLLAPRSSVDNHEYSALAAADYLMNKFYRDGGIFLPLISPDLVPTPALPEPVRATHMLLDDALRAVSSGAKHEAVIDAVFDRIRCLPAEFGSLAREMFAAQQSGNESEFEARFDALLESVRQSCIPEANN